MLKRLFYCLILVIVFIGALKMLQISTIYFSLKSDVSFLQTKQLAYSILHWKIAFYLHVFFSFLLLFTGILQFIPALHRTKPGVHRLSGAVYLIVLLFFSAPSGILMGWYANGGMASKCSFVLMGIIWWAVSFLAYLKLRKKEWKAHGEFMLRSFAITLSAIMLRFYALLLSLFETNATPLDKYTLIAWLSWVPNLLLAEWLIQAGFSKWYLKKING
jgi:hypothetical protein